MALATVAISGAPCSIHIGRTELGLEALDTPTAGFITGPIVPGQDLFVSLAVSLLVVRPA